MSLSVKIEIITSSDDKIFEQNKDKHLITF